MMIIGKALNLKKQNKLDAMMFTKFSNLLFSDSFYNSLSGLKYKYTKQFTTLTILVSKLK